MADLQSDDYYTNLGVAREASEQEIKTAYVSRKEGRTPVDWSKPTVFGC